MKVYHGTSKRKLKDIESEGINVPSYWINSFEKALDYAKSWGDPVVLQCETDDYDFRANMIVAEAMLEDGDIDELPDEYDLEKSLEYFEGIVCHDVIRNYEIVSV